MSEMCKSFDITGKAGKGHLKSYLTLECGKLLNNVIKVKSKKIGLNQFKFFSLLKPKSQKWGRGSQKIVGLL